MKRFLLFFTCCLFFVFEVNGQTTIAAFVSSDNAGSLAATTSDANVTVGDLTRGAGISYVSASTYNSDGFNNASLAASVTDDALLSFTITVVNNVTINLTDLDIRYDRSGTGPTNVAIEADLNSGGFNNLFTDNSVSSSGENNADIDLSSISLVQGDILTIRIVPWGASAAGGTFDIENAATFGNNGIVVNGNIVVSPPPSDVPTLSQWGLIILALSFMILGTLYLIPEMKLKKS